MGKLAWIATLALAAGCAGDGGDPHELGRCDDAWGPVTACEAACENGPTTEAGFGTCETMRLPNDPNKYYCPKANERDGGCCLVVQNYVRWFECL